MNVSIFKNKQWIQRKPSRTIFVIAPGAGVYSNRFAYQELQKYFTLVYIGKRGDKYDRYPDNWSINKNVHNYGDHLGGLSRVFKTIVDEGTIPCGVICGSRGGQVTLGKVWEDVWRGPSIIINAGCLTSRTHIPKGVFPLFITMEGDYFKSVNTFQKVIRLFYNYVEDPSQKAVFIHLLGDEHMPNLNSIGELFHKSFDFLLGNSDNLYINDPRVLIKSNF